MATLAERVKAKDMTATLAAREAGASGSSSLVRLASDADPEVRELTLLCLDEMGGPEAERMFSVALMDPHGQVRSAAMRGARHHSTAASVPALLNAFDYSGEAVVRENVLLTLGGIPGAPASDVRRRWEREKDEAVRDAGLAALARLGDVEARQIFVERVKAAAGAARGRWLELCEYAQAEWALGALLEYLDDTSDSLRIGADNYAQCPMYLRVCDRAVNLAARLSRREFRFRVAPNVQYSPSQIQEVRDFLRAPR